MAVQVFDVHLVSPWKILWRHSNTSPAVPVLLVEQANILNAHPDPGAALPLCTLTKINRSTITQYTSERVIAPFGVFEPEDIRVIPDSRVCCTPTESVGLLRNVPY